MDCPRCEETRKLLTALVDEIAALEETAQDEGDYWSEEFGWGEEKAYNTALTKLRAVLATL